MPPTWHGQSAGLAEQDNDRRPQPAVLQVTRTLAYLRDSGPVHCRWTGRGRAGLVPGAPPPGNGGVLGLMARVPDRCMAQSTQTSDLDPGGRCGPGLPLLVPAPLPATVLFLSLSLQQQCGSHHILTQQTHAHMCHPAEHSVRQIRYRAQAAACPRPSADPPSERPPSSPLCKCSLRPRDFQMALRSARQLLRALSPPLPCPSPR